MTSLITDHSSHDVARTLKDLESCEDSIAWAHQFGNDYTAAYEACHDARWIMWLAAKLIEKSVVPFDKLKIGTLSTAIVECVTPLLSKESLTLVNTIHSYILERDNMMDDVTPSVGYGQRCENAYVAITELRDHNKWSNLHLRLALSDFYSDAVRGDIDPMRVHQAIHQAYQVKLFQKRGYYLFSAIPMIDLRIEEECNIAAIIKTHIPADVLIPLLEAVTHGS